MKHIKWLFAILLLLAAAPNANIFGTVTDTKGDPIEGVVVKLVKFGFLDTTNYWGEWAFKQPVLAANRAARSKAITGSLFLENGSLSLKFKGVDVMGRGPRPEAAKPSNSVLGARLTADDAFIDTLIFSIKGKVYKKVGVRSYTMMIGLGAGAGVIDTVNRAAKIPWNESVTYDTMWRLEDGQPYRTVKIGSQTWMAENLKGMAFSYGTNVKVLNTNVDSTYEFGTLFNWSSAANMDERIYNSDSGNYVLDSQYDAGTARAKVEGVCPEGWHLPTSAEFSVLTAYIDSQNTDTSLFVKNFVRSTTGWPKVKADVSSDKYGFRALKAPWKVLVDREWETRSDIPRFWTSTNARTNNLYVGWENKAHHWSDAIDNEVFGSCKEDPSKLCKFRIWVPDFDNQSGLPVRCVKD